MVMGYYHVNGIVRLYGKQKVWRDLVLNHQSVVIHIRRYKEAM